MGQFVSEVYFLIKVYLCMYVCAYVCVEERKGGAEQVLSLKGQCDVI